LHPGFAVKRDTLLHLASEVTIRICGHTMVVEGRDDAVCCDAALLRALERLRRPGTLAQALALVDVATKEEWMAAAAQMLELVGAGALSSVDQVGAVRASDHGFGFPEPHIGMLADHVRTSRYIDAIRRAVVPGDVVIDLGTGTGVLAIAAARAGAARVYAIERASVADIAERMFERNGVADRITLVRDVSTRVSLPERAHVLVSEIIGTEPLCERLLEYTRDASERLLLPGARMVPQRMRRLGRAVTCPDRAIDGHVVTAPAAARWESAYGMDFSALAQAAPSHPPWFTVSAAEAAAWPALTETVTLADIDLTMPPRPPLRVRTQARVSTAGRLDGILVFWEIALHDDIGLSTDPLLAGPDCCWGAAVWLAAERRPVAEGDVLDMRYQYQAPRAVAEVALHPPAAPQPAAGRH
jgi:hypothetical protein